MFSNLRLCGFISLNVEKGLQETRRKTKSSKQDIHLYSCPNERLLPGTTVLAEDLATDKWSDLGYILGIMLLDVLTKWMKVVGYRKVKKKKKSTQGGAINCDRKDQEGTDWGGKQECVTEIKSCFQTCFIEVLLDI